METTKSKIFLIQKQKEYSQRIRQRNKKLYNKPIFIFNKDCCPICLEPLLQPYILLCCHHFLHIKCMYPELICCPICRTKF
jgi:hypothetical protein